MIVRLLNAVEWLYSTEFWRAALSWREQSRCKLPRLLFMNGPQACYLLSLVLLLPLSRTATGNTGIQLRWGLRQNNRFFREVSSAQTPGTRAFQMIGGGPDFIAINRCVGQGDELSLNSKICESLEAQLAPDFEFKFKTENHNPMRLKSIRIKSVEQMRSRGLGLWNSGVRYDLLLPDQSWEAKEYSPPKPFVLTTEGALHLRCWPEMGGGGTVKMKIVIDFIFQCGEAHCDASTGPFDVNFDPHDD